LGAYLLKLNLYIPRSNIYVPARKKILFQSALKSGSFGSMFDFNRDGTLDALERAVEFQFFDEIVMGNDSEEDDYEIDYNDDYE